MLYVFSHAEEPTGILTCRCGGGCGGAGEGGGARDREHEGGQFSAVWRRSGPEAQSIPGSEETQPLLRTASTPQQHNSLLSTATHSTAPP